MRYCKHESSPCATICWGLTSLSRFGMRCLQIHICKLPTKSPTPSAPLPKWQNSKTAKQQNIQRKLETVHCTLYIVYSTNCQQDMHKTNNKTNTPIPSFEFHFHVRFWLSFHFVAFPFGFTNAQRAHTNNNQTLQNHHTLHFHSDNTFPGDTTITTITTINHETQNKQITH